MCVVNSASSSLAAIHVRPIVLLLAILPNPPPRFDGHEASQRSPSRDFKDDHQAIGPGSFLYREVVDPPGTPVFNSYHLIARRKVYLKPQISLLHILPFLQHLSRFPQIPLESSSAVSSSSSAGLTGSVSYSGFAASLQVLISFIQPPKYRNIRPPTIQNERIHITGCFDSRWREEGRLGAD